jgi:hypothetical protein
MVASGLDLMMFFSPGICIFQHLFHSKTGK